MSLTIGVLLVSLSASAQFPADSVKKVDIMDYLPPLQVIIDSAVTNSPNLDYLETVLEAGEYNVSQEKKAWSNDVRFQAGYTWTYGNQLLGTGLGVGGNQINEGYNYGVVLSIPLSSWYGRSDRINRAEAQKEGYQAQIDMAERDLREMVIETYNQVFLLHELLLIFADAKESSKLILEMAEERFRDGELSLEELSSATDYKARSAADYERTRTEFSNAYSRLERLAGVSFSKFKK